MSQFKRKSARFEKKKNMKIKYVDVDTNLEVRKIVLNGIEQRGVFATKDLEKNTFVVEYAGKLLNGKEAIEIEKNYAQNNDVGCFMLFFKFKEKKYCIDATVENCSVGRLINHSKKKTKENIKPRIQMYDDLPRIVFFSTKKILENEELFYDYGDRSQASIALNNWLKY